MHSSLAASSFFLLHFPMAMSSSTVRNSSDMICSMNLPGSMIGYLNTQRPNNDTKVGSVLQSRLFWTYGRYVIRARLPMADMDVFEITLTPGNPAYKDGDKNYMRLAQTDQGEVVQSIKFDSLPKEYELRGVIDLQDAAHNFHTYTLDWTPSSISMNIDEMPKLEQFIDRKLWTTNIKAQWDVAYGWTIYWGLLSQDMQVDPKNTWRAFTKPVAEIDYIRVYRKKSLEQNL